MFKKEQFEGVDKVLVFGTGGGNDIVSALWAGLYLHRYNIKTDIAGVLSPVATHYYNGKVESEINRIEGKVERIIQSKKDISIPLIDGILPGLSEENGIDIEKFYNFSIRFGTKRLIKKLNYLIKENNYDMVIAIDVGGDVLARGPIDSTLLSPSMDFASLNILKELEVETLLVEFGLGTDGELRPDGMKDIINELKEKQLLLSQGEINMDDNETKKFIGIYSKIRKIRLGNTGRMTLKTLGSDGKEDIYSDYFLGYRIGNLKIRQDMNITLPKEFFKKTFVIDGKKISSTRLETGFGFNNPLEQYIKLRKVPSWKTEMDLFHIYSGENYTTTQKIGLCIHLLSFSDLLDRNIRNTILLEGVKLLNQGKSDVVLMNHNDYLEYKIAFNNTLITGNYILLYRNEIDTIELNKIRNDVEKYQN